jgi:hypothetical protein
MVMEINTGYIGISKFAKEHCNYQPKKTGQFKLKNTLIL